MTHYNTDYSGLAEPEKSKQAIEDIKGYLGEKTFAKVNAEFLADPPENFDHFAFICTFAGVKGFPVRAWYNSLFPPLCEGLPQAPETL